MALSQRQENFCRQYMLDLNGTQAAIRSGYSAKTATVLASKLLMKANIKEYIAKLKANAAVKAECTRDMVLLEYMKIAFGNVKNFFHEDGTMKSIVELSAEEAATIAGFENMGKHFVKIKFSDKRAALDSICKMLGYNAPEEINANVATTKKKIVFR